MKPEKCTRCNEELKPSRVTWLELSNTNGLYYRALPAGHVSQGAFPFGGDCATRQLKETLKELKANLKLIKLGN
jgi:hypothetical protein